MRSLLLSLLLLPLAIHAAEPRIAIDCTLGKKGREQAHFPTVTTTSSAKPVIFKLGWDQLYTTKWARPSYPGNPTQSPVTFPLPQEVQVQHIGVKIECRAELLPDNLIRLTGTATYSESESVPALHGEYSGPIRDPDTKKVLTPNITNSPVLHTSTTPFQLFARPGQPYTFPIAKLKKQIPLTITCTLKP